MEENEQQLLRSVALENARSIQRARDRAEEELHSAQEALRRTQQDLTDFIENAPVAMNWVGPDGIILWANRTELEMLGYSKEEYIGRRIADFHVDQELIKDILRRLGNRETLHECEARLRCKDGSIRDVLINSNVLWQEDKFIHTRCFTRDITERKQADALMNCQKQAFEMAASGKPLIVVLEFLARAVEQFTHDRAIVAIHLLDESGTRFEKTAAPGLPAEYHQATEGMAVNSNAGPFCAAVSRGERVAVPDLVADGEYPIFASFALRLGIRSGWSTPIISSSGRVLGTIASYYREVLAPGPEDDLFAEMIPRTAATIVEHQQAAEARARLAAIVESSEDAIVSKDLNGVVTSWNRGAERLFGYTAEEMIGQPVAMLIPSDRLDEETNILRRIRNGERVEHYETIRRGKDGTLKDISLTVSPVIDAQGQITGASKIARDISEHKRVEAELKSLMTREQNARNEAEIANRVKDEFLAMVSHELRTPLNAIVGWSKLLGSGNLSSQDSERAVTIIARNAAAQGSIINQILDVSRIISGKLKLDMKPVRLADIINEAIDVVRPTADAKAIEIVTALDEEAGHVAGEAVRLQQVVWNLLTNAIKFTPKQGRVEVQLERAGSKLVVVVSDNGMGIPKDFLPHIFERFQQADNSAKRSQGGLGLGLSIVRNLVEMHAGTISATSGGEGQGATFTFSLPILAISDWTRFDSEFVDGSEESPSFKAEESGQSFENEAEEDLSSDYLTGLRVLSVDDQPDTRDLIVLALMRYGAEVRACTSASAALAMLQNWRPDVIVSDIGMPYEDGYDLMRKIRAFAPEGGGQIPAVALTGFAGAIDESMALEAGYQVHLTKPVELRKLAETIAMLAGQENLK